MANKNNQDNSKYQDFDGGEPLIGNTMGTQDTSPRKPIGFADRVPAANEKWTHPLETKLGVDPDDLGSGESLLPTDRQPLIR